LNSTTERWPGDSGIGVLVAGGPPRDACPCLRLPANTGCRKRTSCRDRARPCGFTRRWHRVRNRVRGRGFRSSRAASSRPLGPVAIRRARPGGQSLVAGCAKPAPSADRIVVAHAAAFACRPARRAGRPAARDRADAGRGAFSAFAFSD